MLGTAQQFEVPALSPVDLTLAPLADAVRGDEEPPPPLRDRLSLGVPVSRRIGVDEDAPDGLRAFVSADAGRWGYHLVFLGCTFKPTEDEPFTEAMIQVSLRCDDEAGVDEPIAWSADPLQAVGATSTVRRSVGVGAKANLLGIEAGPELGISEETTRADVWGQAYDVRTADPYWELRATRDHALRAYQPLSLIVRAPLAAVTGTVTVQASVRRRHLGIFPYEAVVPGHDNPRITFAL